MTASFKEPGHRHPVAHLQGLDALADLNDHADTLVTEDAAGNLTKVTRSNVQVGVAHARILNLDQGLTVPDVGNRDLTNLNRAIRMLGNNNCLHRLLGAHGISFGEYRAHTVLARYRWVMTLPP